MGLTSAEGTATAFDDLRTARFSALRLDALVDRPPAEERTIDVAVLDMNHRAQNLGHAAIVMIVRDAVLAADDALAATGRRVRVLSYPIRDRLVVPAHDGRHALYLGTGGPGHLDPRCNRAARGLEEIEEDPAWEEPLFALFDAIREDRTAAFYGVCHSFGLLCRWSGYAEPVLRGPEKGGKTSGVGSNLLTPAGATHPWFAPLRRELDRDAVPVLDSRYYDLLPTGAPVPEAVPVAFECGPDGRAGDALTMLELARDADGVVPRIFAVNSHPEVGAPERVQLLLERALARGEIDVATFRDRVRILPALRDDRPVERLLVADRVFGDLVRDRLDRLIRAS